MSAPVTLDRWGSEAQGSSALGWEASIEDRVLAAIDEPTPRGIAAAVNRLIRGGRLVTGDRLPTVRDLARSLGVSPATVSEAWQALSAVGAIESRGRAGTFVRSTEEPSRPVLDRRLPSERVRSPRLAPPSLKGHRSRHCILLAVRCCRACSVQRVRSRLCDFEF